MTTISSTSTLDIMEGTLEECRDYAGSMGLTVGRAHGAIIGILGGKAMYSEEVSSYDLERDGRYAGMLQKCGSMWEAVIRKGVDR